MHRGDDDWFGEAEPPFDPPARGRASVPGQGGRVPPPEVPDEPETGEPEIDPLGLIPGPDETTLIPRIPRESAPPPAADRPETRRRRSIKRHRDGSPSPQAKAVRIGGELLLTLGVVVMLFVAYQMWGTEAEINNAQGKQSDAWEDQVDKGKDPTLDPVPGGAIARLYMPQIRSEPWVIVEGTDLDDIEKAPGHYSDSAMPGEKGNFAVAGHNVSAIFRHIDELKEGDKVVIETAKKFFIYEITGNKIVKPTNLDVVAPVPNEPGVKPTDEDRWFTMTTCYPWWDNYERYIVWAQLTDERKRGDALPPEAGGK
ncbi:class E sortase [Stackebrandtia nassauensis]|uniref:Sortase family protein n=1 Tax=Stackebrandtia nassauensis (strain DSM 44728 / CIP 108903 / NRRL B-16338 / NBRC 102104 / LLR-40K-21) TaxID=446470 RepID=D3Q2K5_STANL|nr:class E sortase [Stackebrandtia nassauensis]ADD45756.1 sortase family protein [Stackebrandtia nassauensis DSM 44728]